MTPRGQRLLGGLFLVYLLGVLNLTLFQYQFLLVLRLFQPGLLLNGFAADAAVNLIPLVTLTTADLKTSALNVLMLVPFGLALPLVARVRWWDGIWAGALFSLGIEVLQFATGHFSGVAFRVADINDVLFNTLGAAIGSLAFLGARAFWNRVQRRAA